MLTSRIAHCRAEIARLNADGCFTHHELDGRMARLTDLDLFDSNRTWLSGLPYPEQGEAARAHYDGWVSTNLALRLSEDIKHARAA